MESGDGGAGRCMEGERDVDSDINRILLKYRPIAPKPVVGGSGLSSGGSSLLSGKRTKRKYVRVSTSRCKNKDKVKAAEEEKVVTTLQLLPEKVDPENPIAQLEERRDCKNSDHNNNNNNNFDIDSSNLVGLNRSVLRGIVSSRVVESWITVESVESISNGNDQCEVIWNDSIVQHQLQGDSYPGFISKAESGKVEWVNNAYKRMVMSESDAINNIVLMVVWLQIKDTAAEVITRVENAFSCWVKVQYNNEDGSGSGRSGLVSMVLPCDALRVESGGFVWRLDARAALCLGNVNGRFHPS